jgi:hypothetical protein
MIRVIDICGSSQVTDLAGNPLIDNIFPSSWKERDNVQLIIDTVNPTFDNVYFENVGGVRYIGIFGENIYLNGHDNIYFDICFNEPIRCDQIGDSMPVNDGAKVVGGSSRQVYNEGNYISNGIGYTENRNKQLNIYLLVSQEDIDNYLKNDSNTLCLREGEGGI